MIIIVTVIQNYSITRTIPVPSNSPFLNPGNHHSIFHLYIFFILKMLHKWNHTICELLIIAFYSSQIIYLRSIQIMYIYFVVKLLSHVQLLELSMDCRLPGSSVHGILQARILEWAAIFLLQGIFPTQGSNPYLLHCNLR